MSHGLFFVLVEGVPAPDSDEYEALAKNLVERGELRLPSGEYAKRLPAYSAMLALFQRILGERSWKDGVLAAQFLMALATTVLLALIAFRLGDARAGLLAGLLAALYSPYLYIQTLLLTETLLIILFATALWLYLNGVQAAGARAAACLAGAGVLLAAAALTRANALLLLIPFAVDAAWRKIPPAPASQDAAPAGPLRTERRLRRRVASVLLLVAPTMIACAAWAERNRQCMGAFTLSSSGGVNFYLGHNADYARTAGLGSADYGVSDRRRQQTGEGEISTDRFFYQQGRRFIVEHPVEALRNLGRKLVVFHSPVVSMNAPTATLVCVTALIVAGWGARRRGAMPPARRRWFHVFLCVAPLLFVVWVVVLMDTLRPWTGPAEIVPLGLMSLFVMRCVPGVRGLFIGLYATQLAVGLAFIPLARVRWTVDGLLIVALAVGVSRACAWFANPAPGKPPPPAQPDVR